MPPRAASGASVPLLSPSHETARPAAAAGDVHATCAKTRRPRRSAPKIAQFSSGVASSGTGIQSGG